MSKLPVLREKTIASFIYFIRGKKVMLDTDLAKLYMLETRVLKQAVRRNIRRFPPDFMFELYDQEIDTLVSQNVILSRKVLGGSKPFAFTEQGIAIKKKSLSKSMMNSSELFSQHCNIWPKKTTNQDQKFASGNPGNNIQSLMPLLLSCSHAIVNVLIAVNLFCNLMFVT